MPNFVINVKPIFDLLLLSCCKQYNPSEQLAEILRVNDNCPLPGLIVTCDKVPRLMSPRGNKRAIY